MHINHCHKKAEENIPGQPNTEDDVIVPVKRSCVQQVQTHHSLKNICTECGCSCLSKSRLEEHINKVHFKLKPGFPCDKCSKTFATRRRLICHKRVCHQFKNIFQQPNGASCTDRSTQNCTFAFLCCKMGFFKRMFDMLELLPTSGIKTIN